MNFYEELETVKKLAIKSGEKILEFYCSNTNFKSKDNCDYNNPLTKADIEANKIIVSGLRKFPEYSILTEEEADNRERLKNKFVWIIDPLDGTKEFINNIGEFTINIALVHKQEPVLGVIYVPIKKDLYFAVKGKGSFYKNDIKKQLHVSQKNELEKMFVVKSRFHSSERFDSLLKKNNFINVKTIGSSLKGVLVASGDADVYFRLGPINEWDICAMDIILRESGGKLTDFGGNLLKYNKENTLFDGFVASNNKIHDKLLRMVNE